MEQTCNFCFLESVFRIQIQWTIARVLICQTMMPKLDGVIAIAVATSSRAPFTDRLCLIAYNVLALGVIGASPTRKTTHTLEFSASTGQAR